MERTTTAMATAGVTYPAWQAHLQIMGDVASALVPILSAVWLAVQIVGYVRRALAGGKDFGKLED